MPPGFVHLAGATTATGVSVAVAADTPGQATSTMSATSSPCVRFIRCSCPKPDYREASHRARGQSPTADANRHALTSVVVSRLRLRLQRRRGDHKLRAIRRRGFHDTPWAQPPSHGRGRFLHPPSVRFNPRADGFNIAGVGFDVPEWRGDVAGWEPHIAVRDLGEKVADRVVFHADQSAVPSG
jgi:hypothetical protein